jgi:dTDP-4-amino-4,6-dideoxygalactose transaminase
MQPTVADVKPDHPNFIPWWRTKIWESDVGLLMQAVAEGRFSMGRGTAEFEQELARIVGSPHAIATTSGSMALTLAMMALRVGPGDEVIVPDRTFIATAHAASLLGAKVVLADCSADCPNVDPGEIERKITARTKAIIVVHLNGRLCDMDAIEAIARKENIPIVEDAAQAIFSRGPDRFMGTYGSMGCFSFGMTKLASTGQGGAVVTSDPELNDRLKTLRNHGVRDVVSHEYLGPGGNFKFTDMQAAIGLGQIGRWREKVAHCNTLYDTYRSGLIGHPAVEVLEVRTGQGECALWTEIVSPRRDELASVLAAEGIQTRKFLPCLYSTPHLAGGEILHNSRRFFERGLVLPSGPDQKIADAERTIEVVNRWKGA